MERWQIILGEDVGVNFQILIPEAQKADTVVTITADGFSNIYTADNMVISDGYYTVMTKMAAAQMTDEIAVKIAVADETVWDKTYTIRQYAEYILAGNYSDTIKRVVKEMLNYGTAAQNYFRYNLESLASDGIDMTGVCTEAIPETEPTPKTTEGSVTGLGYYGASLVYESRIAVRFYFTGDITDCSFTANGNPVEPQAKGGMWFVEVSQLNPATLDEMIEISVTKGSETLEISYGPMNYMVRMNARQSTEAELKELLKAMYNYHLAAKEL